MIKLAALVSLTHAACGGEPTSPSHFSVATAADLRACNDSQNGTIVYIEQDSTLRVCRDGSWKALELVGPTGGTGAAGVSGRDGTNGKDGEDAALSGIFDRSIGCNGQLESTTLWFSYSVGIMKSGDLIATGSIRDAYFEIAKTSFYSSAQNGAGNGSIVLTNDVQGSANAGYWVLTLNRSTLVTSIVYNDADVSGGTASWTMTPDKCIAHDYD